MKKFLNLLVVMFVFIPITNVFALKCGGDDGVSATAKSFTCAGINGDKLTFKHDNEDYSKYFEFDSKNTVQIKDRSFLDGYDSTKKDFVLIVGDSKETVTVLIKNPNYAETTTTATTETTTEAPKGKVYNVTLRDGEELIEKKCEVPENQDTCSVTLPTVEKEGFNGWGTAETCKEGSRGVIKVDKDTTYYACYNNVSKEDTVKLYLNSLKLTDKSSEEEIKFGTFSIKKLEYSFKVLYEVQDIEVEAVADEGVTVEIEGNENLNVGKNTITITLKDEENNETVYTLEVNRLKKGESITNTHYLKSLVIGGVDDFKFDKNKFEYTVTIDSTMTSLEITKELENEDDKVEIIGNENLVDGSVVKIVVTGDDGSKTTYKINIVKEANNKTLVIIVGVICGIIVLLTILIFFKSTKKNNTQGGKGSKKEKTKKTKKSKSKNAPEVLKEDKKEENIEVLKF